MIRQEIKTAVFNAVQSLAGDKSISVDGFDLRVDAIAVEFSKDRSQLCRSPKRPVRIQKISRDWSR
ncbi:MAG: hypothetical protein NTX14_04440 [Candidatus Nealsonbacteria bacterium]|nr:hypothetical protein [Candidatus Nealsonbacteria bacterium]